MSGDEKSVPVLYLDLDGTVRQGKDDALGRFVNGPKDVVVFPEALARIKEWKAKGGRVVSVSNQGGIALGLVSSGSVAAAMLETWRQCDRLLDKMLWCQHHPQATDPEMARCWCRKPAPGLIIEAAHSLATMWPGEIYPPHLALMVGDRDEDFHAAAAANVDFMEARAWRDLSKDVTP